MTVAVLEDESHFFTPAACDNLDGEHDLGRSARIDTNSEGCGGADTKRGISGDGVGGGRKNIAVGALDSTSNGIHGERAGKGGSDCVVEVVGRVGIDDWEGKARDTIHSSRIIGEWRGLDDSEIDLIGIELTQGIARGGRIEMTEEGDLVVSPRLEVAGEVEAVFLASSREGKVVDFHQCCVLGVVIGDSKAEIGGIVLLRVLFVGGGHAELVVVLGKLGMNLVGESDRSTDGMRN